MHTLIQSTPEFFPADLLAGLGNLDRSALCQNIALLECVDGIFVVQGTISNAVGHIGINWDKTAPKLNAITEDLESSALSVAVLRFRLWVRLAQALALPTIPPFSTTSATRVASAFAVRASERLSPSIRARRRNERSARSQSIGFRELLSRKANDCWEGAKALAKPEPPFSFQDIVFEEMMTILADEDVVAAAVQHTDQEVAQALREAQKAARNALAAGSIWAGSATVVANAGFLPYILAAQLSGLIPFLGGPAMVSLLATLVNPATVLAGVAALSWIGIGRGTSAVRSQLAARLGVLFSVVGRQERDQGIANLLTAMRSLIHEPSSSFSWLPQDDRNDLMRSLRTLNSRLGTPIPHPAGKPPSPFGAQMIREDVSDTATIVGLTAAEVIWHAAALDPDVVLAADFSRSADIDDPVAFALHAQSLVGSAAGWSLRGYTAERLVMNRLIADGHAVQIAEASNTPGFDLLVDGLPVQVKCGTTITNLTQHFEKYPDIPVIANAALKELATKSGEPWAELVTTLPGFEIADLEARITDTLGHSAGLADPSIIEYALSIGLLRGGLEVACGKIPVTDLPAWLLLDGASRGALSIVGSQAGTWIGLVTIGPAGALVFGPAMGGAANLANSRLKNTVQAHLMSEWIDEIFCLAERLHHCLLIAAERRITQLKCRADKFSGNVGLSELRSWMSKRACDDLVAALEEYILIEPFKVRSETEAIELLLQAKNFAPADFSVLRAARQLELALDARPDLQDVLAAKAKPTIATLRSGLMKSYIRRHDRD